MLKNITKKVFGTLNTSGINPILIFNSIKGFFYFIFDLGAFIRQLKNSNSFKKWSIFPIFSDRFESGGNLESVYFQLDLFVAQKLFKDNPKNHLDIGSRMDGFVANIATFRKIDVIDIRPCKSTFSNIVFKQWDITLTPTELVNTYESISCLHALEHFGLGRYGDKIDLEGHLKGIINIHKILQQNGKFYFATPIGPNRIEFNAHRVFSLDYLINKLFLNKFEIVSFSYIDDKKNLHENAEINNITVGTNFGCNYGCGIFELQKI
jgi:SAM-dependent methyltransferase